MGYRCGLWVIDITCDMADRYGFLPYPYGHPGYQYGIWAHDFGNESIDMVILDIDMEYVLLI
jgi:hypothetical protein